VLSQVRYQLITRPLHLVLQIPPAVQVKPDALLQQPNKALQPLLVRSNKRRVKQI
jgi:hypothetical protein